MIGTRNALPSRRKPVELAEISSEQVELDDDRVVGDVVADVVVTLVGERGARHPVVTHDLLVAVEDLPRCDDLVVRMAVEGGQGPIEFLSHLGIHVLADDLEAALPQIAVIIPALYDHQDGQTGDLTSAIANWVPALPLDSCQIETPTRRRSW